MRSPRAIDWTVRAPAIGGMQPCERRTFEPMNEVTHCRLVLGPFHTSYTFAPRHFHLATNFLLFNCLSKNLSLIFNLIRDRFIFLYLLLISALHSNLSFNFNLICETASSIVWLF